MFSYISLVWLGILWTAASARDCPSLWTVYESSCYLFGHQHLPFVQAEQFCRQHHNSHLVRIDTAIENDFLKTHILYMKDSNWWIGLTDEDLEGHYVWYGTNDSPTFYDWLPGQPDNAGNEDCVEFGRASGKWGWTDRSCTSWKIAPICELVGYTGAGVGVG